MARIKLKDPVEVTREVKVTTRPTLYADKCDGCGLVFEMIEFCAEQNRARLRGTFDMCPNDDDGRGMGNMFEAVVCSFVCAHAVFAEGGWKKIKAYKPFVKAGATLARGEVTITARTRTQGEIVKAWETAPEREAGHVGLVFGRVGG